MKHGVANMISVLRFLGTGNIKYVHAIILSQANGREIQARSVAVETLTTIYGQTYGTERSFMMPTEELVGVSIEWADDMPEGVTDILSALAHEAKK